MMLKLVPHSDTVSIDEKNIKEKNWFVVKTKSRFEKKVYAQLQDLGYTAFLPLEIKFSLWSDRMKKVEVPLIPSVIFVENPKVDKERIYLIPGVYQILKSNGKIGEVTPKEIDHLRILTSSEFTFEEIIPGEFNAGDEVEIISGPFAGYFAKAVEELNNYRILIEINSLGLGYLVDVPKNKIRITG